MKIFYFLILTLPLSAQTYDGTYRAKVKTLDSTIETLYSVISGDAGVRRDWGLFLYLFADHAQLTPIRKGQDGRVTPIYLTPDDYVSRSGSWLEKNGFIEKEIHRVTEAFGGLTHVFSTYESYRSSKDAAPFARGINSIQLMNDSQRWYIINITWQSETQDFPLPDKYLD